VRLHSLVRRRPSASMVVSMVALVMSLGGVGYAATSLPANSVGTAQIRNDAVTYKKILPHSVGVVRLATNGVTTSKLRDRAVTYQKIKPGSVGTVRANLNQLQARFKNTCAAGSAVGAVDNKGKVTCNPTLPAHTPSAAPAAPVTVVGTPTAVTGVTLPAGASYLAFANPSVSFTAGGTSQQVTVNCTLTVGTSHQTRTWTVDTGSSTKTFTTTIPLQQTGAAGPSSVACDAAVDTGTLPAITATGTIDALQIAG
jgi:hypothetical protein